MEKLIETNVVKPDISSFENEQNLRSISIENELFLDGKLAELDSFVENNHGLGKSEQEKDVLYYTAQSTWKEYVERLKTMKYSFYLNRNQYNFLSNLLIGKLEYDVNTVFLAIELTNMLGTWELSKSKTKSDNEVKEYVSDATEITYMYHLIAKHTVKGLTKDTYLFAQILRKIGHISRIVSYYDTHAKTFNKDIQDWASTFDAGVFVEGKPWGRNTPSFVGEKIANTLVIEKNIFNAKNNEGSKEITDQTGSLAIDGKDTEMISKEILLNNGKKVKADKKTKLDLTDDDLEAKDA